MSRYLFFVFAAILTFSASASDNALRIVYKSFDFYVPPGPHLVGFLGTDSDILIAKYSGELGKKIIGFSLDKELNTGGCHSTVFFESVLSKSQSECDGDAIEAFRYVFVRNRDSGVWSSDGYRFFYFIGKEKSTVFLVTDDVGGETYKIESNFLSKGEIKEIFSEYL